MITPAYESFVNNVCIDIANESVADVAKNAAMKVKNIFTKLINAIKALIKYVQSKFISSKISKTVAKLNEINAGGGSPKAGNKLNSKHPEDDGDFNYEVMTKNIKNFNGWGFIVNCDEFCESLNKKFQSILSADFQMSDIDSRSGKESDEDEDQVFVDYNNGRYTETSSTIRNQFASKYVNLANGRFNDRFYEVINRFEQSLNENCSKINAYAKNMYNKMLQFYNPYMRKDISSGVSRIYSEYIYGLRCALQFLKSVESMAK